MNVITNILYWISTGLLVPVIVLLILFFFRALIMVGGFFGQWIGVKRVNAKISAKIGGLNAAGLDEFKASLPSKSGSLLVEYIHKILDNKSDAAKVDFLLSEYEIEADKSLSMPKILAKLGPVLGLMGTLIPMGPALVGLSTGDISTMAYNMQVAFATTVIGLVISAVGFITMQAKERWYVRDLAVLEYIAELVKKEA